MNQEIWRLIPGYEGIYEVSNLGRVRSLDRVVPRRMRGGTILQRAPGKVLSPGGAYPGVGLCKDGIVTKRYVHELVALIFIGPRPDGMQICHEDGNPKNTRASNLRYDTPTGNAADRHAHGTHAAGSNNPSSKIDEATAAIIKAKLLNTPPTQIAKDMGIPKTIVFNIKNGGCWSHVSPAMLEGAAS